MKKKNLVNFKYLYFFLRRVKLMTHYKEVNNLYKYFQIILKLLL